jgi:hypothetical protein
LNRAPSFGATLKPSVAATMPGSIATAAPTGDMPSASWKYSTMNNITAPPTLL